MAEVLEEYEFRTQGNRARYPEAWFDGKIRMLTALDLNCAAEDIGSKKQAMATAAARYGKRIRFNIDEETYDEPVVVVQAYELEEAEEEPKPKRQRRRKSA